MKKLIIVFAAFSWASLWFTPDQQGMRLFKRDKFKEAAEAFHDPMWQGTAWFRAGEFEKAADAFARRDTAVAKFNEANARMLLGKYDDAIKTYDSALEKRPAWTEAEENRSIAVARAKMLDIEAGNMTGGELGADDVVFDTKAPAGEKDTMEVDGEEPLTEQEVQALWLRRVQTRPADFLKAKFAYQQAGREDSR